VTGVKTHFNVTPAEYEEMRGGHQGARRLEFLDRALARTGTARSVVEIGFGTGRFLAALADRHPDSVFHGVEVDEGMVAHAHARHARPNVHFRRGLLGDLPATLRGACDFAYSVDVIHHVHDHPAFFAEVRALLREGGRWAAIEPNVYHPYIWMSQERMKRAGFDEDHFRPWRLEPLLKSAGFRIERRSYMLLFPAFMRRVGAPLAAAERALERFRLFGGSVTYELVAER
jgi:trans-aconitate methyltransferase